jgi:lysophospholipase L1-like esterase
MPELPRSKSLPVRRKLVFAACILCAFALSAELLSRALVDDSSGSARFRQINEIVLFLGTHRSDLMLDYDPERFWKLRPGVRIEDLDNTFWQGCVSNSLGYRSPEFTLQKPPDTIRVVCFGDSSTFGIGTRMEDTWPALLEVYLNESSEQKFQVINAGVPGYTSHQGLQHMRQELDRLNPDVVFASYANNDFWRWGDHTDEQHAQRFTESSLHTRLMQSRALQVIDRLVRPSTEPTASEWAQSTTFNYVNPNEEWVPRVPLQQFETNIEGMCDLCESRRVPLALVLWPDQPQAAGHWSPRIDYQHSLKTIAARRNVVLSDVVSIFQRNRAMAVQSYVPNDIVHVDRNGNRLAAIAARNAVTQCIENSPQIARNVEPARSNLQSSR